MGAFANGEWEMGAALGNHIWTVMLVSVACSRKTLLVEVTFASRIFDRIEERLAPFRESELMDESYRSSDTVCIDMIGTIYAAPCPLSRTIYGIRNFDSLCSELWPKEQGMGYLYMLLALHGGKS